jgi:hypothetical protein
MITGTFPISWNAGIFNPFVTSATFLEIFCRNYQGLLKMLKMEFPFLFYF